MGALMELAPLEVVDKVKAMGVPGVTIGLERSSKCGVEGTKVNVSVHGVEEGHETHDNDHQSHHHRTMADIENIIEGLDVSEYVKADAMDIYEKIADAESRVHGQPVSEVHFHEVGTMDAITDVVGNCMLIEAIGADRVVVSPINVGSGTVKCAHGILPVPAPATALLLEGATYYGDNTEGELCTPTGAAILQYYADEYGSRPMMKAMAMGVGVGTKDFAPRANILRVFLGEEEGSRDKACELSANIDDMNGEELGFAMERLLEAGAVDVYFVPVTMKKSRPAIKLSCLCRPEDEKRMVRLLFKYTRTAGIRRQDFDRYVLDRYTEEKDGLRVKVLKGYGVEHRKVEYDDMAAQAIKSGASLDEVKKW